MRHFFRLRFALNAPPAHFRLQKHERPQNASVRENKQSQRRKLELRWHVAIGWHVAVDFETDADFNQNRGCPSHSFLLLDLIKIIEPKIPEPQVSVVAADDCGTYRALILSLEYGNLAARFPAPRLHPNA